MMSTRGAAAALTLGVAAATYAQSLKFTPPRLLKAEVSALPAPTVVGGGEVLIEATVDRAGTVTRPIVLRGTPPYTQMVLDAVATWRFDPARASGPDGRESAVDVPVAIAAVYRPPILLNAPTLGEPPKDWSKPSGDVAYPLSMTMPNYPPPARDGGVTLLEVTLNEAGAITDARVIGSAGGFESASREALAKWRFKGGSYRARPVPATAYVLFGFSPPIGLAPPPPIPPKPGAALRPGYFGISSFR
jgi:Gram-negative bacterial TonB protein C-terminal